MLEMSEQMQNDLVQLFNLQRHLKETAASSNRYEPTMREVLSIGV